jgi:hypothetical protein
VVEVNDIHADPTDFCPHLYVSSVLLDLFQLRYSWQRKEWLSTHTHTSDPSNSLIHPASVRRDPGSQAIRLGTVTAMQPEGLLAIEQAGTLLRAFASGRDFQ